MAAANGSTEEKLIPAATKLREYLSTNEKVLVCPGVYDGFSARIALSIGFDCLYMVNQPHQLYNTPQTFPCH